MPQSPDEEMSLDAVLDALHAVVRTPTDLTVAVARRALEVAPKWRGWAIESVARDARLQIEAFERQGK